ncbi:aminoglycoside phosphotransferase family protein [Nocardia sp. NPDC059240]|uniref:aminoglycoside phosphotransferase family protein n=1 Tax=Nocardia sp. NPDC059240 TaxID=3346786 RepID=UPI00368EA652
MRVKARSEGAEEWLERLPAVVAGIEEDWSITVGRAFDSGTEAFVAEAVCGDGTPAVVKVLMPRSDHSQRHEITALRLVDGDGCVRPLRMDEGRGVLLLPRLGRSLDRLRWSQRAREEVLCTTAMRVWRRAPGSGLPTGVDKGRDLAGFIAAKWEELGRPCSERAVEHALGCAAERVAAHDDSRAVLVHGDVHQWNLLEAEGGFTLVDPDGLIIEPEYDLGVLMREDPLELMAEGPWVRAHRLARRCGLDVHALWQWGVIERVSTGLVCTELGLQPVGRQMLAVADRLAVECP